MEEKDITILLNKYKAGTASVEEIALIETWYLDFTEQGSELMGEAERLHTFDKV
ncbi:hypothetical protein HH214_21340 [Mucilaginibacter robiniae]|uniref:Uncharacterized protein n=1 Tax=Mucilaginibacter robiniae TaxID=2728022 RepID=A0A7L5E7F3_9SPHI|nr:hypothetical protein [Mucilaginibacter robiniae]QJD98239.1 hypothetical protein HH214_21340 [Mucilaginibacter robiniae]